jgi:hypothetical protein
MFIYPKTGENDKQKSGGGEILPKGAREAGKGREFIDKHQKNCCLFFVPGVC